MLTAPVDQGEPLQAEEPTRWARGALIVAALCALVAAGCERPKPAGGVPGKPRVVSLTPSLTGFVDAFGRRPWLVGVTRFCPVEDIPTVGDMRPVPELVRARRPDVVLAARYPYNHADLEALKAYKMEVLDLPLTTLADLRAAAIAVGKRLEAADEAAKFVKRLDDALAKARAAAKRRGGAPRRVLLVFDIAGGHVYTTGGADHLGEILTAVGAVNVAAGGPTTTRLALEDVVARAPELIVHSSANERFPDLAAVRDFWRKLPSVAAARDGAVYLWPDDHLAQLGPGLPGAIERFAALVNEGTPP